MKKFLAITLAVVLVLSVAASALAFNWDGSTKTDEQKFGYKIEVIKFTRSTGAVGSSSFNKDANATAVNGADVYFAVKLTVPDLEEDDEVREAAWAKVTLTGLELAGTIFDESIAELDAGIYYLLFIEGNFFFDLLDGSLDPIFPMECVDTDTAKVSAKVTSERDLEVEEGFPAGDYTVLVAGTEVVFFKGTDADVDNDEPIAVFTRTSSGKVTDVEDYAAATQDVVALYRWLNDGRADTIYDLIKDGKMFMSDDNLRAAFGWSYKSASDATWRANSTPIILDPTISIPKTGDNTSVIGFAMIMVALVAAVAVKKVNA